MKQSSRQLPSYDQKWTRDDKLYLARISAVQVRGYRDGSEGKVKAFKPRHYSAALSAV